MTNEDDILLDECMSEINDMLKNSKDWHEALEKLAGSNPELGDKKIIQLVTNYFFKNRQNDLEKNYAS